MSGKWADLFPCALIGAAFVLGVLDSAPATAVEPLPGQVRRLPTTPPPVLKWSRKSPSPLRIPDPNPAVAPPPPRPAAPPPTVFERCRDWPNRKLDPQRPRYCRDDGD